MIFRAAKSWEENRVHTHCGSKHRAIIFDFDGTLYDFHALSRRLVMSDPLNAFKMKAERVSRRALLGSDMGSMAALRSELFSRIAAVTKTKIKAIEEWYVEKYLPLTVKVLKKYYRARKNADCLMESLRAMGIKVVVLSDYPCVQDRLEAIGLDKDLFDVTLSTEDIGALKPCERPFLEVASALGVSPNACLVVGDRIDTDGDGARVSTMDFVRIAGHKESTVRQETRESSEVCSVERDDAVLWDDFSSYALMSVE